LGELALHIKQDKWVLSSHDQGYQGARHSFFSET
jgi:hypothetical protein